LNMDGGILEHVGCDHEPDPATPDEYVLELRHLAILPGHFATIRDTKMEEKKVRWNREEYLCCDGDVLELTVLVVLALDHGAAVHLAGLEHDRDHVPRRLVQQLHRDTQATAHLPPPLPRVRKEKQGRRGELETGRNEGKGGGGAARVRTRAPPGLGWAGLGGELEPVAIIHWQA
jgi:hypothetical protein